MERRGIASAALICSSIGSAAQEPHSCRYEHEGKERRCEVSWLEQADVAPANQCPLVQVKCRRATTRGVNDQDVIHRFHIFVPSPPKISDRPYAYIFGPGRIRVYRAKRDSHAAAVCSEKGDAIAGLEVFFSNVFPSDHGYGLAVIRKDEREVPNWSFEMPECVILIVSTRDVVCLCIGIDDEDEVAIAGVDLLPSGLSVARRSRILRQAKRKDQAFDEHAGHCLQD